MQEIFSNTTLTVNQLIEQIDTGALGLPELQRPFIWKDAKVRDLFDSMMRGYPIGYLMLWECPTLDKSIHIGVEAHSYASPKEVIIDGQQRLTSLYAVMKGKKVICILPHYGFSMHRLFRCIRVPLSLLLKST